MVQGDHGGQRLWFVDCHYLPNFSRAVENWAEIAEQSANIVELHEIKSTKFSRWPPWSPCTAAWLIKTDGYNRAIPELISRWSLDPRRWTSSCRSCCRPRTPTHRSWRWRWETSQRSYFFATGWSRIWILATGWSPLVKLTHFHLINRADRKSQVGQCLGFSTDDCFASSAESAEEKPKHF